MQLNKGQIYHIFNQGNNREIIYFNDDNYLYFIKKIRQHIVPYADVLAYCLMPNHFHILIYLKEIQIEVTKDIFRSINKLNWHHVNVLYSRRKQANE
jgi:putative transposase